MGLIETIARKVGFVPDKTVEELMQATEKRVLDIETKSYAKLFEMAQEWRMFSDTPSRPYEQISSVYKSIKAIADSIGQADLAFYDWKSEKEVQPEDLIRLFDKPNPYMSGSDFFQAVAMYYSLYGEAFIVKTTSVGQAAGTSKLPAELWTFNPTKFQEIKGKDAMGNERLNGWKYNGQTFTLDEIVHIKDINPYNAFRGLAPTLPIDKIIDINWNALVYNQSFFKNDATPGFGLKTDQVLDEGSRKRLQAWWESRHKGASKAHKAAVFEAGLTPVPTSTSHKDMDFIGQLEYVREEEFGIWRVPKAFFSITDGVNYATFTGQMKVFWLYTLIPLLKKIAGSINNGVITPYNAKIYCKFDTANVPAFKEDILEKVLIAKDLVAMGFTANEVNEKLELGFDNKPWRDKSWIPYSMVPAGEDTDIKPTPASTPPASLDTTPAATEVAPKSVQVKKITQTKIWKRFIAGHSPIENKFASALKKFFYTQRKLALASIDEKAFQKSPKIIINWDEENKKLSKLAKPYLLKGIEEGLIVGEELTGEDTSPEVQSSVGAYLQTRASKITGINDTVRDQLTSTIDEAVANGETMEQIKDRVRSVYTQAGNRTAVIARTETTGTINGGQMMHYSENGVQSKEWITTLDGRERPDHAALNGNVVPMDDPFANGLMFPGDDGPPEEVINCRCTIAPVMD